MTSSLFRSFHAAYPPAGPRVPYDPVQHGALAEHVPSQLVDEWRSFGFGPYGNGILWTIPPDEPFLDPESWKALDGTGVEVLRSAFADVCLWQGETLRFLNVHTGNWADYSPNVEVFFDSMTDERFRKAVLWEPMLRRVRKRLGDLAADECFGFAPLPALGGASEEKYVVKVKMREYTALASQALG